ncbi:MAG: PAS domain S-box protein [Leptolyngbyaceae bacterium]|nr:PAS domain S-box protein [Leptolyngbyaceae bacterium]
MTVTPDTPVIEVVSLMGQVQGCYGLPNLQLPAEPQEQSPAPEQQGVDALGSPPDPCCSCVLVMEASQLVGILTASDVVRLAATGVAMAEVKVSEVMTCPVITLADPRDQNVFTVLSLFRQHHIHHLPVLDGQGQLIGLMTLEGVGSTLEQLQAPIKQQQQESALQAAHQQLEAKLERCTQELTQVNRQLQHEVAERQHLEEQFRNLAETMSGWVWEVDEQEIYTYASPNVINILGYTPDEILGKHRCDFMQPMAAVRFSSLFSAIAATRQPFALLENTILHKQGCEVVLETSGIPCFGVDGKFQGYRGMDRDVTERKQVEAELERQSLRSRSVAEIVLKIRQSLQLEKILQTTVTEVRELLQVERVLIFRVWPTGVGKVLTESVAPAYDSVIAHNIVDDCLATEHLHKYGQGHVYGIPDVESDLVDNCMAEYLRQFEVKAKLVVPILLNEDLWGLLIAHQCSRPRQWADFEIEVLQQLSNHVSIALAQAQLLEAQRVSEEKFRNLIEQTTDWVWEVGPDMAFTYVSPRSQDILGYQSHEVLGKNLFELMPADEAERSSKIFTYFTEKQQAFAQLEVTLIHKYGHLVILETSGSPILDRQGTLQGYRGIARDITGRKHVDRQIRQALEKEKELSNLKTRFVSMTSHEFRTPLSVILNSSELLEHFSQNWPNERKVQHLQRIQSAVKTMTQLLEDVLLLGSSDAGKLQFNPIAIDLALFCRDLIGDLQLSIGKQYVLTFTVQGNCEDTYFDERLLRSILSNLLSNAIKYSPPGGLIRLELSCEQGQATFQVHDQGIGIPLEDQTGVFESFYRAENVGTIPGTGLGLAIVKRCVDLCQGEISMNSEVGVGTTFTVKLPCQPQT